MSYGLSYGQLRRMEKQQARVATSPQNTDTYRFTISPTCPPSTSIHFRGGLLWWPSSAVYSYGYYIPSYTVDLTDPDKVSVRVNYSSYTYTFTNPYWYAPAMIVLSTYGLSVQETWPAEVPDDAIYLRGTTGSSPYLEEFETAAEAENEMGANRQLDISMAYGFPSATVILRNNGNITDPNQYMPVDLVNRGRSYLFRRCLPGWEAQ